MHNTGTDRLKQTCHTLSLGTGLEPMLYICSTRNCTV